MSEDDGVVVDVDHVRFRGHLLHDLVQVRRCRKTGSDVEELADAPFLCQEVRGAVHEPAVFHHVHGQGGPVSGHGVTRFHIHGVVVLATQDVVVHPGGVGP